MNKHKPPENSRKETMMLVECMTLDGQSVLFHPQHIVSVHTETIMENEKPTEGKHTMVTVDIATATRCRMFAVVEDLEEVKARWEAALSRHH